MQKRGSKPTVASITKKAAHDFGYDTEYLAVVEGVDERFEDTDTDSAVLDSLHYDKVRTGVRRVEKPQSLAKRVSEKR